MMTNTSRLAFFLALLLLIAPGVAGAQEIRKYVTPDGKVIYSDEPVPGAREVGAVAPPPEVSPEQRRAAEEAARREAEQADEATQRSSDRANEETSQRAKIRAAEQQLEAASRKLEQGKEPLPGERKGTAGGASRLTEAYFERQRANEQAVEQARQNLESVRSGR